jgi:hypothetical protein
LHILNWITQIFYLFEPDIPYQFFFGSGPECLYLRPSTRSITSIVLLKPKSKIIGQCGSTIFLPHLKHLRKSLSLSLKRWADDNGVNFEIKLKDKVPKNVYVDILFCIWSAKKFHFSQRNQIPFFVIFLSKLMYIFMSESFLFFE